MNPETSLSNQQITEIFRQHKLDQNPKISRITIGFTNEVHQVDDYILRICVRPGFESKFKNEVRLYKELKGKAMVPELVIADDSFRLIDKPYMIYKMLPGEPAGSRWHLLNDSQRRLIIKDFCGQLRIISRLEPNPQLDKGQSWQDFCLAAIDEDLAKIEKQKLLPDNTLQRVKDYIEQTKPVLQPEKLTLFYWDANLDNIIIDKHGKMVGLIDFEHVSVVSLDFVLDIVRQIQRYPWLNLSTEYEKYADKKDYEHLMEWFEEFYPELFDFPQLEKRLDFYELEGILRKIPRFPTAKQLHERLAGIIGQA